MLGGDEVYVSGDGYEKTNLVDEHVVDAQGDIAVFVFYFYWESDCLLSDVFCFLPRRFSL